ncbi:galectin-4-like [Topomyia yanbarensis]|uniref:galectin-4-like n=1 Tax=Topomyia yanbarensis TaxID=2498891 RepID=UPI00273B465E|nr:galectin-4-like [Topomyia yanbarensis]
MTDLNGTFLEKCFFSLQLPKEPAVGDEIVLKGVLKEDARRFSVNLCLARTEGNHPQAEPDRIAYHLGWKFCEDGCEVMQCSKNSLWSDMQVCSDVWFNERKISVIFRFHADTVKVFIDHTQQPPEYEYEHQFPIEEIQSFELWDDFERVEEITLRFSKGCANGY